MTRPSLACLLSPLLPAVAVADVFTITRTQSSGSRLVRFSDTGQLLGTVGPVGGESADALAIGPDGYVYVSGNFLGYGTLIGIDGGMTRPGRTFDLGTNNGSTLPFYAAPAGMAVGPDGDLYVTSNPVFYPPVPAAAVKTGVLRFSTATGRYVETVFRPASASAFCSDVAFGPDGRAYVAASDGIYRTTPGSTAGELFIAGVGGAIDFDAAGNLYTFASQRVGTVYRRDVVKFDAATGAPLGTIITGSLDPTDQINGIDFSASGELLATVVGTDYYSGRDSVYRYDATTGAPLGVFATLPGGRLSRLAVGPVPEPTALTFLGVGGLMLIRRKRTAV